MSRCDSCSGKKERPCAHEDMTREYYDAIMPAIRHVSYRYGYAIGVHGSLKTDIDLIAAPWRKGPATPQALAEAIRDTIKQIIGICEEPGGNPSVKPEGRLAWSFYMVPIGYPGPYVDLSVLPVPVSNKTPE